MRIAPLLSTLVWYLYLIVPSQSLPKVNLTRTRHPTNRRRLFFTTDNTMSKGNQGGAAAPRASDALLSTSDNRQGRGTTATVRWTVADLFAKSPAFAVFYHCVGTAYDMFTPMGAIVGGLAHPLVFRSTPLLQCVANGGLIFGITGLALGAMGFVAKARGLVEDPTSPPWNEAGLVDRRDRLRTNFMVRALDLGTFTGLAGGAVAVAVAANPSALGLHPGALGVLQALTLGAATGSLVTLAYIASVSPPSTSSASQSSEND